MMDVTGALPLTPVTVWSNAVTSAVGLWNAPDYANPNYTQFALLSLTIKSPGFLLPKKFCLQMVFPGRKKKIPK